MLHDIKIRGQNVFIDDYKVGEVSFHRSRSSEGVEPSGFFTFMVDGNRYHYDTSHFSYSWNANNYIRWELKLKGEAGLREMSEVSRRVS